MNVTRKLASVFDQLGAETLDEGSDHPLRSEADGGTVVILLRIRDVLAAGREREAAKPGHLREPRAAYPTVDALKLGTDPADRD